MTLREMRDRRGLVETDSTELEVVNIMDAMCEKMQELEGRLDRVEKSNNTASCLVNGILPD